LSRPYIAFSSSIASGVIFGFSSPLAKNELGAKFIAIKDIRLIINSIMIRYNSFFIKIFIVKIIQKIGLNDRYRYS
jgi:hypothetical protein